MGGPVGRGGGGGGGALPLAVEEGLGGGGGTALYRYLSVSFHGTWLRVYSKSWTYSWDAACRSVG